MRTLVIDDNVDTAQMFAALLTHCGHRVAVATDAQSALRQALDLQPEVVFLDIGLPDVDGYTLAKCLRQHSGLLPMRIVALSGYAPDEARVRESGIDDYLMKPANLELIHKILGPARGARLSLDQTSLLTPTVDGCCISR